MELQWEVFGACCDINGKDAVLSKLMPPHTSLKEFFLSTCTSSAIQLVPYLSSLTFCEVASPTGYIPGSQYTADGGFINLTPLTELPNLQTLSITDGNFYSGTT